MRQPYPSDLTEEQWQVARPLIPVNRLGRPREVDLREVLNAIFYVVRSGCQWDMLPHDFPPQSTVSDYFAQWRDDGTWQNLRDALRQQVRKADGRVPSPSAASIDSQTVKATEIADDRGYDGGTKITGRKRHILVATLGLLLVVLVTAASADDGTTAPEVLRRLNAEQSTRLEKIGADGKYRNHTLDAWLERSQTPYVLEVVERPPGSKGFVLLQRRWVVERTFAWIGRYRRNSRDYERFTRSSEAMIKICSIHRMLRILKHDAAGPPYKYRENQAIITG